MGALSAKEILDRRVSCPPSGAIRTVLSPFAILTYAVDPERLRELIPDQFQIPTFGGSGLVSAVPFMDTDFRLRYFPAKFRFGQVNYRAYVVDRVSGEPCVWFFGTTLGSPLVVVPKGIWKMPWHRARHCFEGTNGLKGTVRGAWGSMDLDLEDTGLPPELYSGFEDADEMDLVLTHPLDGYYRGRDGRLGTYSVWHERICVTRAKVHSASFSAFEELGLLSPAQMLAPVSALFCPCIEFWVKVPPRVLSE